MPRGFIWIDLFGIEPLTSVRLSPLGVKPRFLSEKRRIVPGGYCGGIGCRSSEVSWHVTSAIEDAAEYGGMDMPLGFTVVIPRVFAWVLLLGNGDAPWS